MKITIKIILLFLSLPFTSRTMFSCEQYIEPKDLTTEESIKLNDEKFSKLREIDRSKLAYLDEHLINVLSKLVLEYNGPMPLYSLKQVIKTGKNIKVLAKKEYSSFFSLESNYIQRSDLKLWS